MFCQSKRKVCIVLLATFAVSAFLACSKGGSAAKPDRSFDLIQFASEDLLSSHYQSFNKKSQDFSDAVVEGCRDTIAAPVKILREVWQDLAAEFHFIETIPMGPIRTKKRFFYTRPPSNLAKIFDPEIDQAQADQDNYKPEKRRPVLMGLGGFEYVLFEKMQDENEILKSSNATCGYLKFLSRDLKKQSQDLLDRWQSEVILYNQSPEGLSRIEESFSQLVGEVVVFADKELKDKTVGAALGLQADSNYKCVKSVNCHEIYLEHPFANFAKPSLVANLQALNALFNGELIKEDGFGFNQYLVSLGVPINKDNKAIVLSQLIEEFQSMPGGEMFAQTFADYYQPSSGQGLVANNSNPAYIGYLGLRDFTTWLKVDFVNDLSAVLPGSVQGDND